MFGLFRKKSGNEDPLEKRIKTMKCRQVSFEDCDLEELIQGMEQSADRILKLTPVNYYAVKNDYIRADIYTSPDYEENYVRFRRISSDRQTGRSRIYALDRITVSKALAKVGIIISDGGSY